MNNLNSFHDNLTLLGGGNMGRAMLTGWLKNGLSGRSVTVIDPSPSDELKILQQTYGFKVLPSLSEYGNEIVKYLIVAVKPQILEQALQNIGSLLDENTMVISLVAGKKIELLEDLCSPSCVVRTIPNTPALVGKGATGAYAGKNVSSDQIALASLLLSAVGIVEWVKEETQIDMITALSGSGPAYVFFLTEAMAQAGVELGLDSHIAMQMARATVQGAGFLLETSPEKNPADLRQNVTSPGGTTEAALNILTHETTGLKPLMYQTLQTAFEKSLELSQKNGI